MPTTDGEVPVADRRKRVLRGIAIYQPGCERVKKNVHKANLDHDARFLKHDPDEWQTDFSLTEHCQAVADFAVKLCLWLGGSAEDALIAEFAGRLHDTGKHNEVCHDYRRNRSLTKEEMEKVDLHPEFTSEYILNEVLPVVRKNDHPFWLKVGKTALHHHEWWRLLFRPQLRKLAAEVAGADCFISPQETRHRPGLTLEETLEYYPQIFTAKIPLWARILFCFRIRSILKAVREVAEADIN